MYNIHSTQTLKEMKYLYMDTAQKQTQDQHIVSTAGK